ncbi:DUF305 domain-containing protein [Haliscomenobacter hydrossis]|uniref:DUF305 domain-containing protein n=1 Tax=Haliscomenobacter hydrossis (strain ATCC 27775 / DSM 1100 / LMG 10767 / O) TaxID=760192 RepID=F4KUT8_HALH1|nr:DUF305 domain-containing protein [Haliscomenobacter hydrossis]AEE53491.1 protein of unknown function DUF305 [Haliscomenobacter hydrossis DSM 1100]
MQKNIVIAAAAPLSVCFLQSCGNTDNHPNASELDTTMHPKAPKDSAGKAKMIIDNDLMYAMSSTMAKMKIIMMSGDFDLDFANMMILHHQAAIDMSRVEIAQGRDEQIKAMALDIITLQNAQIVQMQEFVLNYNTPAIKVAQITEKPNPLGATMKTMMDKMNNMPMTGNTDQDFVAMMIPHHRAAVKMAEDELKHGKSLELKKLAKQMIVDQNEEIEEFKAWIINHK